MINQDGRKDFSREELDQMRAALLELVESNRELAALFPANLAPKAGNDGARKVNEYDAVREQILQMSDKDLTTLRSVMDPAAMQQKLAKSRTVFADFRSTANTAGLPGITSYCGAPVPSGLIVAADVVYFLAESVRDIAQDGCNEVIVILGEGGNGRLVCLVTDAVYIIAKAVYAGVHFCDDDYAASVGEANHARLEHIHSDLETSVANDDANKAAIIANDDANKTAIVNNDNTNKTAIVNNDNTNKTAIVNNDNTNTAALTALITSALNAIITNANANKDELKNLVLRTQIEADLAAADSATPVAIFQTPSTTCTTPSIPNPLTQCGYLDLVGAIVRETIANQGGPNMAAAQALLAQADAQKAAGQFRAAYTAYRKAYKTSSK
ncbi:MAG TPA: hypothetical protein VMZ26_04680 [Pyrinomonadaceae bacterium]|nr:hypothetical protein [Pyrinomonadaceae bacterium]